MVHSMCYLLYSENIKASFDSEKKTDLTKLASYHEKRIRLFPLLFFLVGMVLYRNVDSQNPEWYMAGEKNATQSRDGMSLYSS